MDRFYVLNYHVENNQVDNQLNDIDPKVYDGNELVLELYEHERVKLNHYVEVNCLNSKKNKKKKKKKVTFDLCKYFSHCPRLLLQEIR